MTGALLAFALLAPGGADAATATGPLTPELAELATPAVAAQPATAQAEAIGLPTEGPGSLVREGERVIVEAQFEAGALAGREALESAGAKILTASREYQTVALSVEPEDLLALAAVPGISSVAPTRKPVFYGVEEGSTTAATTALTAPNCEGGSVISQGVEQLNVPAARAAFGARGAGETVGVISDSFNSATTSIEGGAIATKAANDEASNDLPGPASSCGGQQVPVRVIEEGPSGATDEGRAMLQVVHDLAPEAQLAFATAEGGELMFARSIERLAEPVAAGGAGANVIVDDVGYFTEPFFQEGPVAVAIQKVTSEGVIYLTAAGNDNLFEGEHEIASWERSGFLDTGCPGVLSSKVAGATSSCMNFSPTGTDSSFRITVERESTLIVDLQWAEPWHGVQTDLDAYLLNEAQTKVLAENPIDNISEGPAEAFGQPTEVIGWENNSNKAAKVQLVIDRCINVCNPAAKVSAKPRLKFALLEDGSGVSSTEYRESKPEAGIVVGPTVYGHAGSTAAITLGATNYAESASAPKEPERYSSRGPVTHYFGPVTSTTPAAALAVPEALRKPNLTATDCASTTFFAQVEAGAYHFCGTSEAAPHAAAVAALMREINPLASSAAIAAAMEAAATQYTLVTSPEAVGAGLLNAAGALSALGAAPPAPPAPASPAPVVTIIKGPKALSREKRPTFEFTSTQPAGFSCQLDGGAAQSCASPYVTPTLGEGSHSFSVTATGAGGSGTSGVYSFTVDTKAPRAKIVAHPKKTIKTRKSSVVARFKLKADEAPVTFYCRVDREPRRICGKKFRHRFALGKHVLKVKAKDAAGNVTATATAFHFRVKRLRPARSAR